MKELFIGLMSGTSMDTVDAVLVDFSAPSLKLLATHSLTIPDELRNELISICAPGSDEINRMGKLDIQIGNLFADTVNALLQKTTISSAQITAIGSHGQTIRHQPNGEYRFTLQIGDPNIIAAKTHITTIADFRRKDMALGGQGAPLAPAFHNAIFRDTQRNRIILNLGGIANITYLPADFSQTISGFDTGPANTLLDAWINKQLGKNYDDKGEWAASGNINKELITVLLADPYFKKAFPKSTGREYFNLNWLEQLLAKFAKTISAVDIQATLSELTVQSIAQSIKDLLPSNGEILICGGGIKNDYLIQRLTAVCNNYITAPTDNYGVPAKWLEAIAFAWFAKQTLNKKASNLPSVTGAAIATILGGIYFS